MNITRLAIKNFLSISDVQLVPGRINQIVGGNNQGKTTILRALEVAFKGSPDGSLVMRGEEAAEIIVEFDDVTLRRRIRADGKQDVSVKKGEFKADSPQALLNNLLDSSAFNPLDLLDPKQREEAILRACEVKVTEEDLRAALREAGLGEDIPPLDYSQHGLKVAEQAHKFFYQRRAEANKAVKEREEFLRVKEKELPPAPSVPNDPRTDDELRAAISSIRSSIADENAKFDKLRDLEKARGDSARRMEKNKDDLNALEKNIERLKGQLLATREELERSKRDVENIDGIMLATKPDLDQIQKKNDEIGEVNQLISAREKARMHAVLAGNVEAARASAITADQFADRLNQAVTLLGGKFQEDLMKRSSLPVDGLAFRNGRFFLDDSSIENLSTSASLRLAVALARKLGQKTKLICLDGAEALDEASYALLREHTQGDGYTYFITKVGEPFQSEGDHIVRMVAGNAVVEQPRVLN